VKWQYCAFYANWIGKNKKEGILIALAANLKINPEI
jgi:DNA-binding CsgD family transcriptional regulator